MAKTIASGVGLTNDWLASQGVLRLKTLWAELAHLRGTAAALLCVEPTRPDRHARWCEEGARKQVALLDYGLCGFFLFDYPCGNKILSPRLHSRSGQTRARPIHS